jgi:hypothetical protein
MFRIPRYLLLPSTMDRFLSEARFARQCFGFEEQFLNTCV